MKIVQIGMLVAVIALIVLFILGYIFNWTWTGVGSYVSPTHPQGSDFQREKTLYDWFQLAIIPVALTFGVLWLNRVQQQRDQQLADERAKTERWVATDNQREAALQAYIDKMSELLLEKNTQEPNTMKLQIMRVRTLTVLPRLDGKRKGSVVQFLYESGLIENGEETVALEKADLSGANLHLAFLNKVDLRMVGLSKADISSANLSGASLYGADLRDADLSHASLSEATMNFAYMSGANLTYANLSKADLTGANLTEADLSNANLRYAKVTKEQLNQASSLKGTIMSDGTKHA